jgi:Rrf2 family protein
VIFSKTCQAGLKSIAFLASIKNTAKKYSAKELAKAVEENDHTLGKVLQLLVKHEIISSLKGPNGGFFIEGKQRQIPVIRIVEVIDGKFAFNQCAMGFNKCSEKKPCAFHGEFKKSRKIIEVLLIEKKISDLGKANSLFNEI